MQLATLYQKAVTGKITQWRIWTVDDKIYKEYGEVGGKLQVTEPTVCVGKNIGKKNETTPKQQAELEAKAEWQKKLNKKYSKSIKLATSDKRQTPMLAAVFETYKNKIKYPVYVQPKYDGNRDLVSWKHNNIQQLSRGNKLWNIVHLQNALTEFLPNGMKLDGEIYIHGMVLQDINRLIKKYVPGKTELLEYHVYDCFDENQPDRPFKERLELLNDLFTNNIVPDNIKLSKTIVCNSEQEVYKAQLDFVKQGYEGAIVRTTDGLYKFGKRSQDLLKVKSFQDAEFKVVGYKEGVGKNAGCVTWICETSEGKQFDCTPKCTYAKKREYFDNAINYVGKLLTVKFFNYTNDNIPFLPVGKLFREEEDLE